MPTTSNGIYKVILEQKLFGQTVFNTFYYRETGGLDGGVTELATIFDTSVASNIATIQSTSLLHTAIRVQNPTGTVADAVITPTLATGQRVGTDAPVFISAGMTFNRAGRAVRNGSKRWAGMLEEDYTVNTWDAPYLTVLGVLIPFLTLTLSAPIGTYDAVIARPPVAPSTAWTYENFPTVTVKGDVTTQNSRKRGVGE